AALTEVESTLATRNLVEARSAQMVSQLKQFLVVDMKGPVRASTVTARPCEGEDLKSAINRLRDDLDTAQRDLAAAKAATPTRAELEQQLREHVQSLIDDGRPQLRIDKGKLLVTYPDVTQFSSTGVFSAPSGSASRLFAALDPDRLYDYL